MKILGIVFFIFIIWMAFEMWRAPLGEETEDGYRQIRPPKKFKDLWRKQ
jgi:threonine/homoserine/homoserine lactone efflux protein